MAGIFCLALASCSSYRSTAPIMGITNNSIETSAVANIDYSTAKRVEGFAEETVVLGIFHTSNTGNKELRNSNRYGGLGKMERRALYQAKKNGDVDVILEPEFEYEHHNNFFSTNTKVWVRGWGVKMHGVSNGR